MPILWGPNHLDLEICPWRCLICIGILQDPTLGRESPGIPTFVPLFADPTRPANPVSRLRLQMGKFSARI